MDPRCRGLADGGWLRGQRVQ